MVSIIAFSYCKFTFFQTILSLLWVVLFFFNPVCATFKSFHSLAYSTPSGAAAGGPATFPDW